MIFGIVLAAFGYWDLGVAAFGSGELLDIAIPTLAPLVFLLSLACPCLCNDEIKSEHAHNSHTSGGGKREHVKLLHNSSCHSYPLIIHIT